MKDSARTLFMLSVRKFYPTVCKKLMQTLPLTNSFLHDLQFLNPISKELDASEAAFARVSEVV